MLKVIAIVSGVLIALLGSVALLVFVGIRGFDVRDVSEVEKVLLASFSEYYPEIAVDLPLQACESYSARTNLDGSLELEYEYDSDNDPESPFLFYVSGASIERNTKSAMETFSILITGFKAGAAFVSSRKIIRIDNFHSLGDQNYSARIEDDGETVGNIFVIRNGKIVQSLLILGFTIEDPGELESLLQSSVTAARNWE